MRDYGRVYSAFWTSTDVQALTDDGRLLALYLLSGPHGTLAGVCRLPEGYVCEDLRWKHERVSKGFAELSRKGFVTVCEGTKWIWIRKFLTWNRPENPNQWKSARKIAESIPAQCSFKTVFLEVFSASEAGLEPPESNGCETVAEPLGKGCLLSNSNSNSNSKGSAASFDASLVGGLDTESWQKWVDYRKQIGKPIKPPSMQAAAVELAKFGGNQATVVQHSIANSYQGLYAPKGMKPSPASGEIQWQ